MSEGEDKTSSGKAPGYGATDLPLGIETAPHAASRVTRKRLRRFSASQRSSWACAALG
jgi:hypothetical protein